MDDELESASLISRFLTLQGFKTLGEFGAVISKKQAHNSYKPP